MSTINTEQVPGRAGASAGVEHQERCRSCGDPGLIDVLKLGEQPLANTLRAPGQLDLPEARYPLDLAMCPGCSLVQILDSVPPAEMFENYPYFSSVVQTLVTNARDIATRLIEEDSIDAGSLVIEVASNDGYLLQHYRDAGIPVLGIEPARNVAVVAERNGIPTRCEYFGPELAEQLVGEGLRPKVVHANNVLAHVPDLNGFVAGISTLIGDWGRAVIEVPYVKDFLDRRAFDTIYHEHLCYFSVTALDHLMARHDLEIERLERIPIHGESLRLFVRRRGSGPIDPSVDGLLEEERGWGLQGPEPYRELAADVERIGSQLRELLGGLKGKGASIAAYGAAAKGATLLNTFGIGAETLDFVADASPHKQGLHMPGSGLPIRPPQALVEERPDYVLLLAWNLVDEIMRQQEEFRQAGGRFIVPVPEPEVL